MDEFESTPTPSEPTPPEANGEPSTAANAPEFESMRYAETLLEPEFAANRNAPCGSAPKPTGAAPAAKGEPLIGVSAPLLPMVKPSTALWAVSVTKRKRPECSATTAAGVTPAPSETVVPPTSVRFPFLS